jgi:hypothetical protein
MTEANVADKKEDAKRTVMAPTNARPVRAGELISVELRADEDVRWIWSHHCERGSSVTAYTIARRETGNIPKKRPIGFFPLEEKSASDESLSDRR